MPPNGPSSSYQLSRYGAQVSFVARFHFLELHWAWMVFPCFKTIVEQQECAGAVKSKLGGDGISPRVPRSSRAPGRRTTWLLPLSFTDPVRLSTPPAVLIILACNDYDKREAYLYLKIHDGLCSLPSLCALFRLRRRCFCCT